MVKEDVQAVRGAHRRRRPRRRGGAGPSEDRRPEALRRGDRENVITFSIGPAGTGKSYLAVALAVQALQAKHVNRIILTRPAVEAGERSVSSRGT